ncbi:glucokinase [Anaerocolumna cellulosilytica]|uniref:Glucokinase n=1 Tax=Anaerocolumna cellulosilytica TaxID=433286 RepID=A0A6S6R036_9FIRM|nr:ROK family glucokinase [Anaerocolumna cellulosilytica]MBB5195689.1 glucokinase [Anaerocolumna cellulosilytica]BCJ92975.1 glucokinase [Anaerocolumna cellulosilytica]
MEKLCFGIDVGGTTVKLGLFTETGNVLDKWEIPTRKEEAGKYILSDIADSLKEKLTEKELSKEQILGIGVGVPGPVIEESTVLECVNLGWGIVNVAEELKCLTGFETKVGNDANVAALGEMWQGGGKGFINMVLVTLGTGVGGGVILNGEILTGSNGAAGEIGHITVNYDEEVSCNCGKQGCLEQFASATGIVKEAGRMLKISAKPSKLRELPSITAKDIFDLAKEGDVLSVDLVEQLGRYLGLALSHVAAVVDPQVFVIGGGVSKAGSILLKTIQEHYNKNVMRALKNKEFHLAELGNDAGIFGGAKLIVGK